jgi:predicted nuclease of predicted toxin-antitoxin system
MSFLFDQNISHRIHKLLDQFYKDSFSVKSKGLINASDIEIWETCSQQQLNIITQDADFNFIQSLRGFPPKIIWIRLGNKSTAKLAEILNSNIQAIEAFLQNDNFGILEVTEQNQG